jgi:hypothetical protein
MKEFEYFERRAQELEQPITEWIQMTDDPQDLMILAFVMMNNAQRLLDNAVGEEARKYYFEEFV